MTLPGQPDQPQDPQQPQPGGYVPQQQPYDYGQPQQPPPPADSPPTSQFQQPGQPQYGPDMPARRTAITLPGQSEATPVMAFPVPEVVTIPRHIRVRHVQGLTEAALGDRLNTPLTPDIIESLPEGPDEDSRRTQRFTYVLDATGTDGRRTRGIVRGPDTYGTTAVIAVESARRLVADPAKPGVLAPAQAYHPAAFLDFLRPHGIQWIIEE